MSSAKEIDSITKKNTANDKEEANPDEDMDAEEEPDDVHIFRITNPRWEGDPSHSCGKKKKGKPNGCWMVTSFWDSEKYSDAQRAKAFDYPLRDVYKDRSDLVEDLLKDEGLDPALRSVIENLMKPKGKVKDTKSKSKGIKKATKCASNENKTKHDNETKDDYETLVAATGQSTHDDIETVVATQGQSIHDNSETIVAAQGQSINEDNVLGGNGTIVTADADGHKLEQDKRSPQKKASPKKKGNKTKPKQPSKEEKKVYVTNEVNHNNSNDSDSFVTADNEIIPTVRV